MGNSPVIVTGKEINDLKYFVPLKVGKYCITKHRGDGFYLSFGDMRFNISNAEKILKVIEDLESGRVSLYLSSPLGIRVKGDKWGTKLLKAVKNKPYPDKGKWFLSILENHKLSLVALGEASFNFGQTTEYVAIC